MQPFLLSYVYKLSKGVRQMAKRILVASIHDVLGKKQKRTRANVIADIREVKKQMIFASALQTEELNFKLDQLHSEL